MGVHTHTHEWTHVVCLSSLWKASMELISSAGFPRGPSNLRSLVNRDCLFYCQALCQSVFTLGSTWCHHSLFPDWQTVTEWDIDMQLLLRERKGDKWHLVSHWNRDPHFPRSEKEMTLTVCLCDREKEGFFFLGTDSFILRWINIPHLGDENKL